MSNNNGTELRAWASNVCALRNDLGRPIESPEDTRWAAWHDRPAYADIEHDPADAVEYGRDYFDSVALKTIVPSPPIDAPVWCDSTQIETEWPRVIVWHRGKVREAGGAWVQLEQYTAITCEADSGDLPGDVYVEGPTVQIGGGIGAASFREEVSIETAQRLIAALGDTLTDAHR